MSRYKETFVYNFPIRERYLTPQNEYWNNYKVPTIIKETAIITHLDITFTIPYKLAITSSTKVQLYDLDKDQPILSFSNFKKTAHGGSFRKDGELIISGCEDGIVRMFSMLTKSQLREFKGHQKEVHLSKFTFDNFHVVSGSDDTTLKYWDLATSSIVSEFKDHADYIRSGAALPTSSNLFMTGSYDHSAKMFDFRCPEKNRALFKMDHSCPVESVLVLPNERIAFTAGGNVIKVWDLAQSGRELQSFSPHSKTITALAFSSFSNRLISASLDRQVRVHDISTFDTIHSHTYSDPIISLTISPRDEFLVVGMVNGLVAIRGRRPENEKTKKSRLKIFEESKPETQAAPSIDDVDRDVLSLGDEYREDDENSSHKKLRSFDRYFKKFQFSQSFDKVFSKVTLNHKSPHVVVSYLRELIRRNKLKAALAGRTFDLVNDPILANFIKFLIQNLEDPRFIPVLLDVGLVLIDLYLEDDLINSPGAGFAHDYRVTNAPVIEKLVQIINRNANIVKKQMCTLGVIDSLTMQNELSRDVGISQQSEKLPHFEIENCTEDNVPPAYNDQNTGLELELNADIGIS